MLTSLLALTLFTQAHAAAYNDRYVDVQKFMRGVALSHAATTQLVTLGKSDLGPTIEMLKIGNGPVAHLVVATHHGNEFGSTEVAKALARSLAAKPLEGLTVYVLPVLNTNGYDVRRRGEEASDKFVYDANRDYPGPCGTEGPFHLKSTALLARFLDERHDDNGLFGQRAPGISGGAAHRRGAYPLVRPTGARQRVGIAPSNRPSDRWPAAFPLSSILTCLFAYEASQLVNRRPLAAVLFSE